MDELIALRQSSPGFRPAEVTALLGASYTNLAAASDNADNLEEALTLYDKALALQPDPTVQSERDLISMYLDALTYSDADWPRAIQALEDLYAEEPQYRDVESRLQDAHTAYGDQLAGGEQWCLATEEYESALSVINNPTIATKRDAAETECAQNGDLAASGGLTGTTITSATAGSTLGLPGGAPTAASAPVTSGDTTDESPKVGTLLYSAKDINSGAPRFGRCRCGWARRSSCCKTPPSRRCAGMVRDWPSATCAAIWRASPVLTLTQG
ncbi:MAG: tetratricopeptide repeat protein [Anaerolineales bacterium]|nr:tetratricopeptide repeat protein [Anaerolineales bacterium]